MGVSQFVAGFATLAPAQYVAVPVETPAADTAYKFALEQVNLGKTLYFSGEMSGNYFATTEKADKAVDVYLEAVTDVENAYRIYFMDGDTKTYLEIYEYTAGKVGVHLTTTPTTYYTYSAEAKTYVVNIADTDYYLGTYKTFNTISASKASFITGDNAANVGVSQFVAGFVTIEAKEVEAVPVVTPEADTAYKFALEQVNLGKTLYFSGEMSGNYFATTDRISKAVDVYLEAVTDVENAYRIYFMDGDTKTYLEIYEYTAGKVGVHLTTTPTTYYTYSAEAKTYVVNIADTDYYLGTYKTFNTISASKASFITGDNAANVGVSQFVAGFATIEVVTETAEPTE